MFGKRNRKRRRICLHQNITATTSDEDVAVAVFSVKKKQYYHVVDQFVEWVGDSVTSYHVTPKRELFASYKAGNFGEMKMGNDSHLNIV